MGDFGDRHASLTVEDDIHGADRIPKSVGGW